MNKEIRNVNQVEKVICEQFAYLPNLLVYSKCLCIKELSKIRQGHIYKVER